MHNPVAAVDVDVRKRFIRGEKNDRIVDRLGLLVSNIAMDAATRDSPAREVTGQELVYSRPGDADNGDGADSWRRQENRLVCAQSGPVLDVMIRERQRDAVERQVGRFESLRALQDL